MVNLQRRQTHDAIMEKKCFISMHIVLYQGLELVPLLRGVADCAFATGVVTGVQDIVLDGRKTLHNLLRVDRLRVRTLQTRRHFFGFFFVRR